VRRKRLQISATCSREPLPLLFTHETTSARLTQSRIARTRQRLGLRNRQRFEVRLQLSFGGLRDRIDEQIRASADAARPAPRLQTRTGWCRRGRCDPAARGSERVRAGIDEQQRAQYRRFEVENHRLDEVVDVNGDVDEHVLHVDVRNVDRNCATTNQLAPSRSATIQTVMLPRLLMLTQAAMSIVHHEVAAERNGRIIVNAASLDTRKT
jgi:hypothetical protein